METIIPVLVMCLLSFLSVREFNKAMSRKQTFINKIKAKLNKKENNFYRMTLTLTLIFVFARICDMIVAIIMRCLGFVGLVLTSEYISVFNFARQITLLLMYASHAFGFYIIYIIYLTRDNNLRGLVRRLLGLKTVNRYFFKYIPDIVKITYCFYNFKKKRRINKKVTDELVVI